MTTHRKALSAVAALALLALAAGSALGHDAKGISGTVDCDGNYSIDVMADVWGGVHLIVTLDGSVISDAAVPGNDQSVHAFGPFTGTGASAGQAISAYTSDNQGGKETGTLVLSQETCETATPAPTATPTPVVTPTPVPSATEPAVTPTPVESIPNTALPPSGADWSAAAFALAGLLVLGLGLMLVVDVLYRRRRL